jgi:hypothetical protein
MNKPDRADILDLKCSLLEMNIVERELAAQRDKYRAKFEAFRTKYKMSETDQLNLETGEIIRAPKPEPVK